MHSVLKRTQLLLLLQQFRRFVQQGVDVLLIFRSVIGLHRNRLFLLTLHVARERIVIDGIGILVNGRSFFILLICMYTHTPIDMVSGILQSCIHCGGEHVQHSLFDHVSTSPYIQKTVYFGLQRGNVANHAVESAFQSLFITFHTSGKRRQTESTMASFGRFESRRSVHICM